MHAHAMPARARVRIYASRARAAARNAARIHVYTNGSLPDFATNLRYDSESPTSSATTRIPGTFLHRPKITTFRQTRTRICHDFKYLPRFTCLLTPISRIPDRPPRIPISGRSLLRFVNYEICNSQNRDLFRIPSKFTHIRMYHKEKFSSSTCAILKCTVLYLY